MLIKISSLFYLKGIEIYPQNTRKLHIKITIILLTMQVRTSLSSLFLDQLPLKVLFSHNNEKDISIETKHI
jgi:hypothetical protein